MYGSYRIVVTLLMPFLQPLFANVCCLLFKVGVSLDETVKEKDLTDLLWVFGCESSTVSTSRIKSSANENNSR